MPQEPLQSSKIPLQEKIAGLRHKELEATVFEIIGWVILVIGVIGRLLSISVFLNLLSVYLGAFIAVSMAILFLHYSDKRKKLVRKLE
jgi:hypothetical protein